MCELGTHTVSQPPSPATEHTLLIAFFQAEFCSILPGDSVMTIDLEQIRSTNPIEIVIGEKLLLRRSGVRFVGVEHDSLVVTPQTGFYFWNSRDEHGDVFDFVGRHFLNYGQHWSSRDPAQFLEALRFLALRAGITLDAPPDFQRSYSWGERQLVQRLRQALLTTPEALQYATQTRGWDLPAIKAARLGYMPRDKRPILADIQLADHWRRIINNFPPQMMVYVHLDKGRLAYLSGRSIEGKQHYNPPRELIGERQPYFTPPLYSGCGAGRGGRGSGGCHHIWNVGSPCCCGRWNAYQ